MTHSSSHERWMRRTLELAQRGRFQTWPNPMVGCVIVRDDQLLSEGWHQRFGGAHAEVNAVRNLPNDLDLADCTAYVTLEPCSHYGKTPPCADLLIQRGIGKVVVATVDPNPEVGGQGVERLLKSNIDVIDGCLREEAIELNRRFFHVMTQPTPWVTLKWAQTVDGFLDPDLAPVHLRGSISITGRAAARHTHSLRACHDGILVGMNTWLVDAPSLTTRHVPGPNPKRFVLSRGRTPCPPHFDMKDSHIEGTTIVCPQASVSTSEMESWRKAGAQTIGIEEEALCPSWWQAFRLETGIKACLVEGGAEVLQLGLQQNSWNEIHVLQAPQSLESGLEAPGGPSWEPKEMRTLEPDTLYVWQNFNPS